MRSHHTLVRLALVVAAGASVATTLRAQSRYGGPGYLFGEPFANVTVRVGYAQPQASSDIFGYSTSLFTLSKKDFAAAEFGVDLAFPAGDHLEWVFSLDAAQRTANSEYRDWTGSDGLPIAQKTTLTRVPLLAGARWWLRPQGRRIGSLAWVPSRWAPFVSLQGGLMYHEFKQEGDFVNFSAGNSVFAGNLSSSGWAPTAAAAAGLSVNLSPNLALLTQARYVYARKSLSSDFQGFQPIDLSGLSITAGLTFRLR